MGTICLFLLKGKIRFVALPFILTGILSIFLYKAPDILVNQGGALWTIHDKNTLSFSSLTKFKSVRYAWTLAFTETPKIIKDDNPVRNIKGLTVRFDGKIDEKADIIFNTKTNIPCHAKMCISRKKLWKEGTHAVYIKNGKFKIESVADKIHARPWSQGFFVDNAAEFDALH